VISTFREMSNNILKKDTWIEKKAKKKYKTLGRMAHLITKVCKGKY
jgi:hypothetical protein